MNRIEDIIGNKKYAGAVTTNQATRILLEQPNKITYEYELFDNISQLEQFNTEKQTSNKFRFYGKINPIMSLDVFNKTTAGDTQVNIDTSVFDMTLDNWSIVLLKSKALPMINDNNQNVNIKGIKYINNQDSNGKTTFYLDLRKGLPAKTYYNRLNQKNACLYFPLGHNFKIDDKVYITSKNSYNLPTGMYKVTDVDVDKVFINARPRSFYPVFSAANVSQAAVRSVTAEATANVMGVQSSPATISAKPVTKFKELTLNQINNSVLSNKIVVRNLTFNTSDIVNFNKTRPNIYPYVEAEFSVAKVIEKEQLEYYIKTLEVVDVIDELDTCGFSTNNFNEAVKNFYLNHDVTINGLVNNLNQPISDLYIGIIKNGAPSATTFGNVESHFSRFIEYVDEGDGLEEVTNNATKLGQKVKKGDVFYHSVCEYTTEQLTETEICTISHKFIHKNVLFSYNPFYKKQIKLLSSYIENGDNVYDIAAHAVFSRLDQRYIWRDIFDIGIADENGNIIDFPFMNGSLYAYTDINFFLKSEKNSTRKFKLNTNDINSTSGSSYSNEVQDILDEINLDTNDIGAGASSNNNNLNGVLPYYQYTDKRC